MKEIIRGTMRGIGALEVSELIKGVFCADEGFPLETVGRMEKRRVVMQLESDYDSAPQDAQEAPARLDTLNSMREYIAAEIAREMANTESVKVTVRLPDPDLMPMEELLGLEGDED